MEPMEKYLRPTYAIDCGNEAIKEKAADLTKGQQKVVGKAKNLFYFVRDGIKYNPYIFTNVPEEFRASVVLGSGEGFCIQKAVLLAALARAVGIPSRLRFADIRNHIVPEKLDKLNPGNVFFYHGYDELYIGGKWIKAAPIFDLRMCEENRIVPVEFDGKNDAILHSRNRDGKLHIEYIQDHGHYDDLPLDKVIDAYVQVHGADYFEQLVRFRETGEAPE